MPATSQQITWLLFPDRLPGISTHALENQKKTLYVRTRRKKAERPYRLHSCILAAYLFSTVAAVFFIPDPGLAFFIELVEMYIIIYSCLVHSNRNQHKPHRNAAFMCDCHILSP